MPWTLDDALKLTQIISYILALPVAAFGIYKHFADTRDKRKWEMAKYAREMVGDLDKNVRALAATYMLGEFEERQYTVEANDGSRQQIRVTQADVRAALNSEMAAPTPDQTFIRDCFDNFLFHLEQWLLAETYRLVEPAHLRPLISNLLAGIEPATAQAVEHYARRLQYPQSAAALHDCVMAVAPPSAREQAHPSAQRPMRAGAES